MWIISKIVELITYKKDVIKYTIFDRLFEGVNYLIDALEIAQRKIKGLSEKKAMDMQTRLEEIKNNIEKLISELDKKED